MARTFTILILFLAASLSTVASATPLPKAGQNFSPEHAFEFKCIDYMKRPVLNVRNDTLNDVAFSDLMRMGSINMGPMTIFNFERLKVLTPASQKFFLAHECGHHVLGHLYFRRIGHAAEQEADCYAIRFLIRSGQFTLADINDVQSDMKKFAQKTPFHKQGAERAGALLSCLE